MLGFVAPMVLRKFCDEFPRPSPCLLLYIHRPALMGVRMMNEEQRQSAEQLSLARQANMLAIGAVLIAAFSMIIALISLGVALFK